MTTGTRPSALSRKNFLLGVTQGVSLRAGNPFIQATTMLPSFLFDLSGSYALTGLIMTIQKFAHILPQIWGARYLNSMRYKKSVLISVAGLRGACWAVIAAAALLWGRSHPGLVIAIFLLCLTLFYLAGGIGTIAFNDLVHKVIHRKERGAFFGWRGFLGGGAAVLTALVARWVLSLTELFPHPVEHCFLFILAALFLGVQILCLLPMQEPPTQTFSKVEPLEDYFQDLIKILKSTPWFRTLIYTKLLSGATLLVTPFYVIFATEQLGQSLVAVGSYTVLVVLAKAVGGLLWGKLSDRYGHKQVLVLVGYVSLLPYPLAFLAGVVHPLFMYGVFFLLGLTIDTKEMLVRNYLLDRSPQDSVPTFSALLNTMSIPIIVFPLIGALLIRLVSYKALFIVAMVVTAVGVIAAFRLPEMSGEENVFL